MNIVLRVEGCFLSRRSRNLLFPSKELLNPITGNSYDWPRGSSRNARSLDAPGHTIDHRPIFFIYTRNLHRIRFVTFLCKNFALLTPLIAEHPNSLLSHPLLDLCPLVEGLRPCKILPKIIYCQFYTLGICASHIGLPHIDKNDESLMIEFFSQYKPAILNLAISRDYPFLLAIKWQMAFNSACVPCTQLIEWLYCASLLAAGTYRINTLRMSPCEGISENWPMSMAWMMSFLFLLCITIFILLITY